MSDWEKYAAEEYDVLVAEEATSDQWNDWLVLLVLLSLCEAIQLMTENQTFCFLDFFTLYCSFITNVVCSYLKAERTPSEKAAGRVVH